MLAAIIPEHRKNVKDFVSKEGNKVVGQVTLEQVGLTRLCAGSSWLVVLCRVLNRPEFSGHYDFRAEKFGRQCAKSGSHRPLGYSRATRKLVQKINIMQKIYN